MVNCSFLNDSRNRTRQDLDTTFKAVSYFYSNGETQDSMDLDIAENANSLTLDRVYTKIKNGEIFIMQLANANNKTNVADMRYLIVAGCDKTEGSFKVYDVISGTSKWISRDILINGGYVEDNTSIKFSGSIIELN